MVWEGTGAEACGPAVPVRRSFRRYLPPAPPGFTINPKDEAGLIMVQPYCTPGGLLAHISRRAACTTPAAALHRRRGRPPRRARGRRTLTPTRLEALAAAASSSSAVRYTARSRGVI